MYIITKAGKTCGHKILKMTCPICEAEFMCTLDDLMFARHKPLTASCPQCTSNIKVDVEKCLVNSDKDVTDYLEAMRGINARMMFPRTVYTLDSLAGIEHHEPSREEFLNMTTDQIIAYFKNHPDGNVFSLHPSAQKTSIYHPGNPKKARYVKGRLERGKLPPVSVVIKKLDDLPKILRAIGFKDSE